MTFNDTRQHFLLGLYVFMEFLLSIQVKDLM